jgi:hypothetical protein
LLSLLHLLRSAGGTKLARAYATDVRSWWKLTYEHSGGIRVFDPTQTSRRQKELSAQGVGTAAHSGAWSVCQRRPAIDVAVNLGA